MTYRLFAALTGLCFALAPPASLANKVQKFSVSNPSGFDNAPEIEVYSTTGEKWTDVDKTDMSKFTIGLSAECQYEGRGNKAYRGSMSVPGFVSVGSKEPANFLIPHSKTASEVFRWSDGKGQTLNPVSACNEELEKRLAQNPNKSKYQLLADGFTFNYPAAFRVNYNLTCKPTGAGFTDTSTKGTMVNAKIKCSASPQAEAKIPSAKPKPKRATVARIEPLLNAVSFEADPEVHVGTCPAPIKFNGSMSATRAGTVKYQYVRNDGRKSPEFSLTFDKPGTQATRAWNTTVSKPDPATTLSAGGAGDGGDIQGWYRLDILSPEPLARVVAYYSVACEDGAPAKPTTIEAAPATVQPKPARATKQ